MLCSFLLYGRVNQSYGYIVCLLFYGYPFHLGHQRALNSVPYAVQQILTSYLFYILVYICQSQPPNSSHPLLPHFITTSLLSTSVTL